MRALRLCLAPGGFLRTRLNRFKTSAYMENVLFGTYKKGDLGVLRHAPVEWFLFKRRWRRPFWVARRARWRTKSQKNTPSILQNIFDFRLTMQEREALIMPPLNAHKHMEKICSHETKHILHRPRWMRFKQWGLERLRSAPASVQNLRWATAF